MPYFFDQNLENDDDQDPSQVQISGASPTTEASEMGTDSQDTQKKDLNTGSGYQNLDKYLNTNQSKEFGQQVLGKVSNEVEGAQKNQQEGSQKFKDQVQTKNQLPTSEQVNSAIANPTGADATQFKNWMTQSYDGPKSLAEAPEAWNQYWSGTNKANTTAQQLGTEAGRFSLLDSYFGKPSYNYGEKSLDNLLVQQSGLGRETRSLQNQATQLRSKGQEEAKQLQDVASQRAGQVEQSRNQVNQAFQEAQQQAQGQVSQTLSQAQAARTAEQNAIRDSLGRGNLSPEQLAKFGLSNGQTLYDLDLTSYLNPNSNQVTKEQAATGEERARLNALAQLSGDQQTYLGDQQAMDDAYNFDTNRFNADVGSRQGAYNNDLAAINAETQRQIALIKNQVDMGRNTTVTYKNGSQPMSNQQLIDFYTQKGKEQAAALDQKYKMGRKINGAVSPDAPRYSGPSTRR